MTDDLTLLKRYTREDSQEAFNEVVSRHSGLVYGACLRQLGDPGLAEDASQAVFIALARKAERVSKSASVAGWLLKAARLASLNAARLEARRRRHEEGASRMRPAANASEDKWDEVAPALDEAMMRLGEADRGAVAMRYMEGLSHEEVGRSLGVTADAARKRSSYALDKLRSFLARRGVNLSVAALGAVVAEHAIAEAPAGLAAACAKSALAAAAGSAAGNAGIIAEGVAKMMMWAKIKMAAVTVAAVTVAAGTGAGVVATSSRVGPDRIPAIAEPKAGPGDKKGETPVAPKPGKGVTRAIPAGAADWIVVTGKEGWTRAFDGSCLGGSWSEDEVKTFLGPLVAMLDAQQKAVTDKVRKDGGYADDAEWLGMQDEVAFCLVAGDGGKKAPMVIMNPGKREPQCRAFVTKWTARLLGDVPAATRKTSRHRGVEIVTITMPEGGAMAQVNPLTGGELFQLEGASYAFCGGLQLISPEIGAVRKSIDCLKGGGESLASKGAGRSGLVGASLDVASLVGEVKGKDREVEAIGGWGSARVAEYRLENSGGVAAETLELKLEKNSKFIPSFLAGAKPVDSGKLALGAPKDALAFAAASAPVDKLLEMLYGAWESIGIDGNVLEVKKDAEGTTIIVSAGSDDGMAKRDYIYVLRGGKAIACAKVTETRPKTSTLRLISIMREATGPVPTGTTDADQPRPGDTCTSAVTDYHMKRELARLKAKEGVDLEAILAGAFTGEAALYAKMPPGGGVIPDVVAFAPLKDGHASIVPMIEFIGRQINSPDAYKKAQGDAGPRPTNDWPNRATAEERNEAMRRYMTEVRAYQDKVRDIYVEYKDGYKLSSFAFKEATIYPMPTGGLPVSMAFARTGNHLIMASGVAAAKRAVMQLSARPESSLAHVDRFKKAVAALPDGAIGTWYLDMPKAFAFGYNSAMPFVGGLGLKEKAGLDPALLPQAEAIAEHLVPEAAGLYAGPESIRIEMRSNLPILATASGACGGFLYRARLRSRQIQCMNNIRQVGLGLIMYSQQREGALPASLDELVTAGLVTDRRIFECPVNGGRYVMAKGLRRLPQANATGTVMAYDAGPHAGGGHAVIFCDGHVKILKPEDLARRLKKQEAELKKAPAHAPTPEDEEVF